LAQGGIAFLEALRKRNIDVPFFLVSQQLSESTVKLSLKAGVADVFKLPIKQSSIELRVPLLIEKWDALKNTSRVIEFHKYKTPFIKRVFDI
ncbi:hypothetical protein ABTD43_18290, partial [Acinetobacter baumannii]